MLLLVSSTVAPRPLPASPEYAPGPVAPPSFGLNSHLATRYPDPDSMDMPARLVEESGATWAREDLHWHRIQPAPDVWDWTFTDAAVLALTDREIEILGVLGPSVGWATPTRRDTAHDVSFYAPDTDAFVEYARAVVKRYHRYIDHWEIWNEPDNELFWQPAPDPRAYAELLRRTSAAIKEVDPRAQVLIGGFNPFDMEFARTVAEAGAWSSFDILAVHPYVDPYGPEEGNLLAALDKMHVLMYRYGHKPMWVTEIGWASGPGDRDRVGLTDEQDQARFLVRSLLLLWVSGVERSFWYMLKDDAHNPYGLLDYGRGRTDYRLRLRKPAYAAFRTLATELRGTQFVGRHDRFDTLQLLSFNEAHGWRRPTQPNGSMRAGVRGVAQVSYNFSTAGNDYVAFELTQPIPLRGEPYALGVWVYGDGSDHAVRAWVRDAEGELLQYTLGILGPPGWRFVSGPITRAANIGNRLEGSGNGRLDFPATLDAVVIDDSHDAFIGTGTIFLDALTALRGHEVYNLRLRRQEEDLDILWSPPGVRASLTTRASVGRLVDWRGQAQRVVPQGGRFSLDIDADPLFLWHQR
jgi:hypothetical protein